MSETKRALPDLELEYELFGEAPVQAMGKVAGRDFYFRARHNHWEFEVAMEDGRFPSDLDLPPVFQREGKCRDASFMPTRDAHGIIERCAREYRSVSSGSGDAVGTHGAVAPG